MVERQIEDSLKMYLGKFPVVLLTGPRQSGKSTLLRNYFPDYDYVSLEEPDIRMFAESDPRGFLANYPKSAIIDEAQYVPQLFSYIQTITDKENSVGRFILSGSQNFLLMQSITQSLAGRAAILKLLPFSYSELNRASISPDSVNNCIFTGGYPRIYDKRILPHEFYPNYIQTYVERDVRLLRNITDMSAFIRFVKLCAGRIGQILNIASLSTECGISVVTANAWLSVLETSYILFQLKPYHNNYNKRLVKSPKLYFYDTGLACSLLGIEYEKQLQTHYFRGELFENWIITEYIKKSYAAGKEPAIYFWRDSNGMEIDLLTEKGGALAAIEIKSGSTMKSDFFKNLMMWQKLSAIPNNQLTVVFGGEQSYQTSNGKLLCWKDFVERDVI
jgi:predicted AAA+ superfamily ATPase